MTISDLTTHRPSHRRRRGAGRAPPPAAALAVGALLSAPTVAPAAAATGSWTTESIAGMSVRLYTPASAATWAPAAR
jgi:poly(3-hydroxybutyrate) depolymerase